MPSIHQEEVISEWIVEEGEEDWALLHELFKLAEQKARGWDNIIRAVETAIKSGEVIG